MECGKHGSFAHPSPLALAVASVFRVDSCTVSGARCSLSFHCEESLSLVWEIKRLHGAEGGMAREVFMNQDKVRGFDLSEPSVKNH